MSNNRNKNKTITMTLDELREFGREIAAATAEEVLENIDCGGGCQCGFDPHEHKSSHERLDKLLDAIEKTRETIWGTFIRSAVKILLGLTAIGAAFLFYQKIGGGM